MLSEILSGVNASGTLTPYPREQIVVNYIDIDVPLDEVGTTDPSVTLSGSVTGAYTFHHSVTPNIRFTTDEIVTLTTANFTAEYSAIIGYVVAGSSAGYYAELNKSQLPLPSRLTRSPRNGA